MTKTTLFDITNELEQLLDKGFNEDFLDEEGEIDDNAVQQAIDALHIALDEKVDGVANYIESLDFMVAAIADKEKALKERRDRLKKRSERLKSYLGGCLMRMGYKKYATVENAVTIRMSEAVEIIDESAIPDDFKVTKTTTAPDKTAIKAAIKAGEIVDGAALMQNINVSIK